jgi:hypothetical protein
MSTSKQFNIIAAEFNLVQTLCLVQQATRHVQFNLWTAFCASFIYFILIKQDWPAAASFTITSILVPPVWDSPMKTLKSHPGLDLNLLPIYELD